MRQGPSPRSAVRVLAGETGHPEVTIRHWIGRCEQLGMLPGGGPAPGTKGLSAKSVWNIHICLRAALNDAVEDGLLKTNPAMGVLKPPSSRMRMKTWTREETAAFLDHASHGGRCWRRWRGGSCCSARCSPRTALAGLAAATPRGVFFDKYQGHPVIPLEVPLQVERDKLLHDLPRHIRALVERIEGLHDSELIQMSGRPRG